jgi:hypothetical protein
VLVLLPSSIYIYQKEEDSHDRTARTGQPDRTAGQDSQRRMARKKLPEQDCQYKIARIRQPGQNREQRTTRKKDSKDKTVRTTRAGQPE